MNNISNLFENLMTYNETNNKSLKSIQENDSTLLNLTLELPNDVDEITPEDVKVDVGVMTVDTDGVEDNDKNNDETSNENDEVIVDDEVDDITPENEETADEEKDEESSPEKEESLAIRKETIRKKRLEAKALREAKKDEENKDCTGKEDCECESCKSKSQNDDKIEETVDVETAKANIRKRVANTEECLEKQAKNESLMHLDTKSLNKLFTEFVKENYKNIDKVVITKAMLENRMLKVEGTITDVNGESTNISLTNRGFNPTKLENKRFIMDFKDTSNTFGVVKESLKQPFIFTCTLKEGVLAFEELKYSYKTMFESKTCEVSGKCTLTEGLFDGKAKELVKREISNLRGPEMKVVPSDDELGFIIETKDKEALIKELESRGYKGDNGVYTLERDKQKLVATFKQSNSLNSDNPEYRVEFSARKKDIK